MEADGELTALNTLVSGAVPDADLIEGEVKEEYGMLYWDSVNGGWLEPKEVERARQEELDWIHRRKIYRIVPRAQAKARGCRVIGTKWIDVNKGDSLTT